MKSKQTILHINNTCICQNVSYDLHRSKRDILRKLYLYWFIVLHENRPCSSVCTDFYVMVRVQSVDSDSATVQSEKAETFIQLNNVKFESSSLHQLTSPTVAWRFIYEPPYDKISLRCAL